MFTIPNMDNILQQEEPQQHPWERFIKNAYASKIVTAHNSINNPHYPKKKEKSIERVKFTVIGNRVTEEFIYCINLVKGLHKYRKDHFESPVIRGVTGVDWPSIWNDLKIQYGGIAYCLKSQVVVFLNDKIVGGEKELKDLIEKDYTYHLSLNYYQQSIAQFANFLKASGLYADVVPYTCENFLRLSHTKKGGYTGTPVHRIVKDGWIQCGGFGLKNTKLDCENFIVPPDKRGVLCMANAGRHVDCSTQFFVLLQPSPWMLHKYVAFGQLIDGDNTLRKIESVETWYESPVQNITIYKAGILNTDCHDIMVNRGAKEYIHGHIEDLFALGEILWEELLEKVFIEIQFRENKALEGIGEGEEEPLPDLDLHATQRFMKKGTAPQNRESVQPKSHKSKSHDEPKATRPDQKAGSDYENNDFDVSIYDYEPEEHEEDLYKQQISVKASETSLVVKPEKPYYIPLTDVPYPGEVSSEYDLKKFLRGDYCLETDLETDKPENAPCIHKVNRFPAEFFSLASRESLYGSEQSLDSDQDAEIKRFLKHHTDSTSFAGDIVLGISHGKHKHLLSNSGKATLTDEELRYIRSVTWEECGQSDDESRKKVSIFLPEGKEKQSRQIHRRPTGFVPPSTWTRRASSDISLDDSLFSRRVHMDPSLKASAPTPRIQRRPTAYMHPGVIDSESDIPFEHTSDYHQTALTRLLKNQERTSAPTLKDYRPSTALQQPSMMLTNRTNFQMKSEEQYAYYRDYRFTNDDTMTLSPDKPRRQNVDEQTKCSLRSIQFAKTRPTLSVAEYQARNEKYLKEMNGPDDDHLV